MKTRKGAKEVVLEKQRLLLGHHRYFLYNIAGSSLVGDSSLRLGSSGPVVFNLAIVVSDPGCFAVTPDYEQKDFQGAPKQDERQNDDQNSNDHQGEVNKVNVLMRGVLRHLDARMLLGSSGRHR